MSRDVPAHPTADPSAREAGPDASAVVSAVLSAVLVVEDDVNTGDAMARLLRRNGWAPVVVRDVRSADAAASGAGGLAFAAAVVDVHLPDGDGIALAGRLRDAVGEAGRVVVLSGDHSVATLGRLRGVGVDRFIGKPLSVEALLHALGTPQGP